MQNNATNRVMDTGIAPVTSWADPVTKKIINFVAAGGQDMSTGFVHATPTDHAKQMVAAARKPESKMAGHYNELKRFAPALKPGQNGALNLQERGMQQQSKMMATARNRYTALKAPAPAQKVAPKPAPMPTSMVIASGNVAAKKPELKVVASNPTPKKPSLAQRMNYWSQGLACNIG